MVMCVYLPDGSSLVAEADGQGPDLWYAEVYSREGDLWICERYFADERTWLAFTAELVVCDAGEGLHPFTVMQGSWSEPDVVLLRVRWCTCVE